MSAHTMNGAITRHPGLWLGAGVLCAAIIVFVLLPVGWMEQVLKPLNRWLFTYVPWFGVSAGKIGHVIAFWLLTLCSVLLARRLDIRLRWLLAALFAFAVATELAQMLVSGRSTRVQDLLFDLSGMALALAMLGAVPVFRWIGSTFQRQEYPS